jgi:hypothetical protein
MFGRKSEQSTVIFEGGEQLSFMPDEKAASAKTSEETITVPEHKRKKKRTFEEAMADLPVEKVIHELEDKTCDKCGAEMEEIGEEKRDELVYTPAKFHIRRHIIKVYKCKNRRLPFDVIRRIAYTAVCFYFEWRLRKLKYA